MNQPGSCRALRSSLVGCRLPSCFSAALMIATGNAGLLLPAHDLADGGLATALVESCLRYGVGASVCATPPENITDHSI